MKRNQSQYDLPLKIVSYKELYGWTMDEIVREIGLRNNCTHKQTKWFSTDLFLLSTMLDTKAHFVASSGGRR